MKNDIDEYVFCTKCECNPCECETDKWEEVENIARNIVFQLDDDSGLSVEFRQANNDRRIDFVKELLTSKKKTCIEKFDKKFPFYMDLSSSGGRESLKQFIKQTLKAQEDKYLKGIENLKQKTRKETGAFKYDFAYDEVIDLINNIKI